MPHTSRMSYLSFFRKSALQRFWLLQEAGKLQETAQAGAVTSDSFSSFACCEAQGDPHLAPFPCIPPAPSHPMCISHSLQRSLCGSCWAALLAPKPKQSFSSVGAGPPCPAPHCGEPCTEICWEQGPEAAQAVTGSWECWGLTSCCSNSPQLSVRAVQMGRQHGKAPTSCEQTPPPGPGRDEHHGDCQRVNLLPLLSGTLLSRAGWTHTQPALQPHTHCCISPCTTALDESCRKRSGKHSFPQPVILPCPSLTRLL